MPEGPEIRRAADRLAEALVGEPVVVQFAFTHLQRFEPAFHLRHVASVTPRGKAMLIAFADDGRSSLTIYSHNQLYGQWQIVNREDHQRAAPSSRQRRMALVAQKRAALLYSASDIVVLTPTELAHHPYLLRLGVELLDPAVDVADVRAQIDAPRFQRKNIGALLLDQAFLAGVGNYLRSDILFVARISPERAVCELDNVQRDALASAALALTRQSYRTGGITNDVQLAARLKREGRSFGEYRHWVFDRASDACHVCGGVIQRISWTGRALFVCGHCQGS